VGVHNFRRQSFSAILMRFRPFGEKVMVMLKHDTLRSQFFLADLQDLSFQKAFAVTRDAIMAHRFGDPAYATFLSGLSFWFHCGIRPAAITAEEFLLLRPLAERWIERRELRSSVLAEFDEVEQEAHQTVGV
jgi:hypothetical protein